jgi:hypothetical protein
LFDRLSLGHGGALVGRFALTAASL